MGEAVRINGHVEHLDRWTDDEVVNALGHAAARMDAANQDYQMLEVEALSRGAIPLDKEEPVDAGGA